MRAISDNEKNKDFIELKKLIEHNFLSLNKKIDTFIKETQHNHVRQMYVSIIAIALVYIIFGVSFLVDTPLEKVIVIVFSLIVGLSLIFFYKRRIEKKYGKIL